jgi:hypothetical protein
MHLCNKILINYISCVLEFLPAHLGFSNTSFAGILLKVLHVFADTFGGNVGLAISQSLILNGMLQHGVRLTAEVVNQMTSVERVLEYTKVVKERDLETHPGKWILFSSFLTHSA